MKVFLGVLLLVWSCSSEEYDLAPISPQLQFLEDDYSDHVDSRQDLDDTTEVYNVTFEHKPERIVRLLSDNELNSDDSVLKERISKTRLKLQSNVRPTKQTTTEQTTTQQTTMEQTTKQTTTIQTATEETLASVLRSAINATSEMTDEDTASETEEPKDALAKYPYAVSLQKKGSHYASGALVSKGWVLTSAGEFYNVRESIKIYRAHLGSVDCKEAGVVVPLKRIELHPSYIKGRPNYDVALISLARDVALSDTIKPIAFSSVDKHVLSAKFISTYWPRILVNGKTLPSSAKEREMFTSMRVSTQHLLSWRRCYRAVNKQNEVLSESSLCLKPVQAHHSICSPDVGAPIASDDGLWGVTSGWVGARCPEAPSPTVVTRTASPLVRSWLDAVMRS